MATLPERLLLLSLDDDGQPRDPRSALGYALAGAAITELLLAGRRQARQRAKQVAAGDQVGEAVRRIQQEVMAAITVAIAASAATAASGGDGGGGGS